MRIMENQETTLKYDPLIRNSFLDRKELRYVSIIAIASTIAYSKLKKVSVLDVVEMAKKIEIQLTIEEVEDALEFYCTCGGAGKCTYEANKVNYSFRMPRKST